MNIEQTKETPKITAKIDEEQSVEEQPKDARIEQQKIDQNEGEEEEGMFVPNWLVEVMEWIKRMEMKESSLSTSCQTFEQLCWPKLHGKVKKHLVELLIFDKEKDQSGKYRAVVHRNFRDINGYEGPKLPVPQEPPPEYILGFNYIHISFLDNRIMEFLKLIAPKINDIRFKMCGKMNTWDKEDEWTKAIQYLLDIFRNKISKLCFDYGSRIEHFNQLFPGFIDPNQIKELGINGVIKGRDLEIAIDWLMNGRQTNEQKIFYPLYLGIDEDWDPQLSIVQPIKEAFLNDTDRRNFLVYLQINRRHINEFRLENCKTGEILHFYRIPQFRDDYGGTWLIRCPKEEEDRWKKEGEKKMRDILEHVNNGTTTFDVYLKEFWVMVKRKCVDGIDWN